MRYVLINKLTNNLVEKIIFQDGGFKPSPEMFPNYLELIVDEKDVVTNYNMRYDEASKTFVSIAESDKDNPKVSKELLDIKLAIAELSEQKDNEILNIELALAEIVEGGLL
ncbi:hypothetical protein [Clostridium paraputrificum]|uniref:hypothetical protein n=1 Tax=Clostridium paraputrificum TaxID=29363 RepID=UPI000409D1DE|nr:hypothetical protein [Clostridium paraputrificum]